eukprot:GHVO01020032.1.p1 GENE.GHVO01020032.1~~GHVO01020032.1.p1  ORF type:complete len:112 (+),score=0.66 GHVO01020032.1:43-378(+)
MYKIPSTVPFMLDRWVYKFKRIPTRNILAPLPHQQFTSFANQFQRQYCVCDIVFFAILPISSLNVVLGGDRTLVTHSPCSGVAVVEEGQRLIRSLGIDFRPVVAGVQYLSW